MYYDAATRNVSFIKMHLFLKNKGIRNNKFFLAIHDKDLIGVDPHNEKKLTPKLKAKIIKEIKINRWYFLREVVRIPVAGGVISYDLNRGNLAQSWCASKSLNTVTMLPRQQGKTIGVNTDDLYAFYFGNTNSSQLYFNKDLPNCIDNLKRFKSLREVLPSYVVDFIIDPKNDTDNEKEVRSELTKNSISVKSAPTDPQKADKLGRGCTVPYIYFDEFAFMKYNDITYKASAPAFAKAHEKAMEMGQPSCKKITTTPNDLSLKESIFCKNLMDSAAEFDEKLYDYTDDEIQEYLERNSTNDFIYIIFHWRELGLSEKWYKNQCRNLENDQLIIKREIDLEWTLSNDMSVFNEAELMLIQQYLREPLYTLDLDKYYKFKFYENIHPEITYIVGVDVGGGLDQDRSAISILHPRDLHTVGTFCNNKITGPELKHLLETLVTVYLPNSIVNIERNSYGLIIIQLLLNDGTGVASPIVENLYWEYREVKTEKNMVNGYNKKSTSRKKVYGHSTDSKTRPIMINNILKDLVSDQYKDIISKDLYYEIKTLIRTNNNKIEHAPGEHDDILFSNLIARYPCYYGTNYKNFSKNYGKNETETKYSRVSNHIQSISQLNKLDNGGRSSYMNDYINEINRLKESENTDKKENAFANILNLNK